VKFLEQEVTEEEYRALQCIMENHLACAPACALSAPVLIACEKLTEKGMFTKKEFPPIGTHYLVPPQVIGAYLSEKGKR
jgi:hypothetical protein